MSHLYQEFRENNNLSCSLSTFIKYIPFCIGPSTEKKIESSFCIKYQNESLFYEELKTLEKPKN